MLVCRSLCMQILCFNNNNTKKNGHKICVIKFGNSGLTCLYRYKKVGEATMASYVLYTYL